MARIPDFGPGKQLLWRTLWYPARLLGRVVFKADVSYEAPVPDGPLVVAANHFAHPDPAFVGLAIRRPVRFLALDELWGNSRVLDRIFQTFGAIPLPRTRYPLSAMRIAVAHLESGGAVGVFPEGRRVERWGEEAPRRGAAWLALRTGALLVPVALWGTQHTMSLDSLKLNAAPVWVRVGRPINPDDYLDHEDPIGAVMEAWRAWMDVALSDLAGLASDGETSSGEGRTGPG